jgi:hypothetical protein
VATIWFVAVAAVASEIYAPLKNFFVSVARHHWTGKSVFAILIFCVVYLALYKMKESDSPTKSIRGLLIHTVLAGLLIAGYFIWHYLSA